jgi:sugar (pentulose or hexulose) kinase
MFLVSPAHGRPEPSRAVWEGVICSCYEASLVLIEPGAIPTRLILAGGGARNALWGQIVADVFGLPVQRLKITEQSALGAALLAGAGINLLDPGATSQRWAEYADPVEPQMENHTIYQELLPLFRDAYWKFKHHLSS